METNKVINIFWFEIKAFAKFPVSMSFFSGNGVDVDELVVDVLVEVVGIIVVVVVGVSMTVMVEIVVVVHVVEVEVVVCGIYSPIP